MRRKRGETIVLSSIMQLALMSWRPSLKTAVALLILVLMTLLYHMYSHSQSTTVTGSDRDAATIELPVSDMRRRIFVIFDGRMGNHMFQYAAVLGISAQNNMTAIIPTTTSLWKVFKIRGVKGDKRSLRNPAIYYDERAGYFNKTYMHLPPSRDIEVTCYLQSYKYFHMLKEEIQTKHFAFRDHIQAEALKYISDVRKEKEERPGAVVVGMHVRRGDFVRQIKKGYGVATRPYLYRAMNYYRNKYGNVIFIVASNDINWCEDNVQGTYNIHFSYITDGAMDFAVLVNCDHVILTTGSYSWWAGYLNKGEVVYYKDYPVNGTWLARKYNKPDYYPDWWKPL